MTTFDDLNADGYPRQTEKDPDDIISAGETHLDEMEGINASDREQSVVLDKDGRIAVQGILEKTTREPHGELGENPNGTLITSEAHRTTKPLLSGVLPKNIAGALSTPKLMGVPLSEKEKADNDRAKELVDELFERIPWEVVIAELHERGHTLISIKELKMRDAKASALRSAFIHADGIAESGARKIRTYLDAASLLCEGLYAEEGDPEVIKTLISSALGVTYCNERELKGNRVRLRDAEEKNGS